MHTNVGERVFRRLRELSARKPGAKVGNDLAVTLGALKPRLTGALGILDCKSPEWAIRAFSRCFFSTSIFEVVRRCVMYTITSAALSPLVEVECGLFLKIGCYAVLCVCVPLQMLIAMFDVRFLSSLFCFAVKHSKNSHFQQKKRCTELGMIREVLAV